MKWKNYGDGGLEDLAKSGYKTDYMKYISFNYPSIYIWLPTLEEQIIGI
jgi:hypothetical protein